MYHTPRNPFQCQPLILCAANDFVVQALAQSKFLNQFGGFEEGNRFIAFVREYINRDVVTPPQRLPMQLIGRWRVRRGSGRCSRRDAKTEEGRAVVGGQRADAHAQAHARRKEKYAACLLHACLLLSSAASKFAVKRAKRTCEMR
jgi:hypothetical protein